MANLNAQMSQILALIDKLNEHMNMSEEELQAYAHEQALRARERAAKRNAKFAAWLNLSTDIQALRIDKLEVDGMKATKIWKGRASGNVAVMLQKEGVYNHETGRIGTKLAMVYPDGRHQFAFGKIAVRSEWI